MIIFITGFKILKNNKWTSVKRFANYIR